jgi:hypothetical protein
MCNPLHCWRHKCEGGRGKTMGGEEGNKEAEEKLRNVENKKIKK